VDLRQLQFLCALQQHGHFGRAAAACHVTQPTLSMRLRNLEEELGLTLIRRSQRFEGFTPEGERLLLWARQIVDSCDGLKSEANRLRGALVGTLRIGMVPLSHIRLMPLLKTMREQAPQVRFQLQALSSEAILAGLDNNTLDLGLTYLTKLEAGRYRLLPLGAPAIGLLFHPAYFDLAQDTPLSWSQLAELPLGLLGTSMRFRQGIDHSAAALGLHLDPVIESDAVEHLIECVSSGLCCTLLPIDATRTPAIAAPGEPLQLLPLAEALPQPSLALIGKASALGGDDPQERLVQALMQLAAEHLHSTTS